MSGIGCKPDLTTRSAADLMNNAFFTTQIVVGGAYNLGHSNAELLCDLGCRLCQRFDSRGAVDDLNNAILMLRRCVELTSDGDPSQSARLNNLGVCL